jgi:mycothione reductase
MKKYDVIVIGSGSGMNIVDEAISHGLKVALVDKGPLGGTCPNLGCIPSKMLIYPADRIVEIQESKKLGIDAEVRKVDFSLIMERMRKWVAENQSHMRQAISYSEDLAYYDGDGQFVSDYTIEVNGE